MTDDWLPLPDHVACALGRIAFYASHLDRVLSDIVVSASGDATGLKATTPKWAESGQQLLDAVRDIEPHPMFQAFADRVDELNTLRNFLIHGIWLWHDDHVEVIRRVRRSDKRAEEIGKITYAELEELVRRYQRTGRAAEILLGYAEQVGDYIRAERAAGD